MKNLLAVLFVLALTGCVPRAYAQEPIPVADASVYIYVMPPVTIWGHPWRTHRYPMQRIWLRPVPPPRNYVQLPKYQHRNRVMVPPIHNRQRMQERPRTQDRNRDRPRLERRMPQRNRK